jgi:hypothetical protein
MAGIPIFSGFFAHRNTDRVLWRGRSGDYAHDPTGIVPVARDGFARIKNDIEKKNHHYWWFFYLGFLATAVELFISDHIGFEIVGVETEFGNTDPDRFEIGFARVVKYGNGHRLFVELIHFDAFDFEYVLLEKLAARFARFAMVAVQRGLYDGFFSFFGLRRNV